MAFTYGFYNSLEGDRRYNSIQVSQLFDGIINDGIFLTIGDRFMVQANGEDLEIKIGSGRAWFDGTWSLNNTDYLINADPSELVLNRIDAVVLEVNKNIDVRENTLKIVTGIPATEPLRPTLINTEFQTQYPLAYIYRPKGSVVITQANVTNAVGTTECPFVTGPLTTMTIDDFVAQWGSEWALWKDNISNDFDALFSDIMSEWAADKGSIATEWSGIKSVINTEFYSWFDEILEAIGESPVEPLFRLVNGGKPWTQYIAD